MTDVAKALIPRTYKAACTYKNSCGCSLIPKKNDFIIKYVWFNFVIPSIEAGRQNVLMSVNPPVKDMESIIYSIVENKLAPYLRKEDLARWCAFHLPDFIHIFYPGLKSPCYDCLAKEELTELDPSPGASIATHCELSSDLDLFQCSGSGNEVDGGARFVHGNGRLYQRHIRTRNIDPLDSPEYKLRERLPFDPAPTIEREVRIRQEILSKPEMIIEAMMRSKSPEVSKVGKSLNECFNSDSEEKQKVVYEYLAGIDPLNLELLPDELATFVCFNDDTAKCNKDGTYKMLSSKFVLTTGNDYSDDEMDQDDDTLDNDVEDDEEALEKLNKERIEMARWGVKVYYQLIQDLKTAEGRYFDHFDPLYGDIPLNRLNDQSGTSKVSTVTDEMRKIVIAMEIDNKKPHEIEAALEGFFAPFEILAAFDPFSYRKPPSYAICPNCGENDKFDFLDGLIICSICGSEIRRLTPTEAETIYNRDWVRQVALRTPLTNILAPIRPDIRIIIKEITTNKKGHIKRYLPSQVKLFLNEANTIYGGKLFAKDRDREASGILYAYSVMMSNAVRNYETLFKMAVRVDSSIKDIRKDVGESLLSVLKGDTQLKDLLQLRDKVAQMSAQSKLHDTVKLVLPEIFAWYEQASYCEDHGWSFIKGTSNWGKHLCKYKTVYTNDDMLIREPKSEKFHRILAYQQLNNAFANKSRPVKMCNKPTIRVWKEIWNNFNKTCKPTTRVSPTMDEVLSKSM